MKILIVGNGGREHVLAWKLAKEKKAEKLYVTRANYGLSHFTCSLDISPLDVQGIVNACTQEKINLVVIGPEAPLSMGIVDALNSKNIRCFGPNLQATQLEASKIFAKQAMLEAGVPTASFVEFSDSAKAKDYAMANTPCVIKADGLASGKGVLLAYTQEQAANAVNMIMVESRFGEAGRQVIVEQMLKGEELSAMALVSGSSVLMFSTSKDHKKLCEGDTGPNTGGMGACSPHPRDCDTLTNEIMQKVFMPIVSWLSDKKIHYKGVLYAGLMLCDDGIKVLEFNVRFGDPETQVLMPRLSTSLFELIDWSMAPFNGMDCLWEEDVCVNVVVASEGYPYNPKKGRIIEGLQMLENNKDILIFHAGTSLSNGRCIVSGGRIFSVSALGRNFDKAKAKVYNALNKVELHDMYYRSDLPVICKENGNLANSGS